ncbi:protoporphyrinogen oxidase HemJ [Pyruvatibacter sp.]|uniref:protoporphyrinogen oxidase HemJ n=1 Tax=Pyruvatibacter sp. TaxID=1981328 RepID=UPI0032ED33D8
MADLYLWVKAFHLIAVIFWMAGMYMLPRLFVYHYPAPTGSELSETMKAAERRLLRIIINPAMMATWLLGIWLVFILYPGLDGFAQAGWLHAKLLVVVGLSALHGMLSGWRKAFERDERPKTERFFRLINEIAPVATIFIVILVIVKPF